ncbi:GmrSD restriction endonuclease domain-containing protein [Actinokineospora sp.]|uniref:GmrSD restriction endonuclease domain-containing protein n=1 Tax=Actinokineospora sp. TaxID=1872133 RepID=UPI004037CE82
MPVDKTEREIGALVGQIELGEIKLPEIQRGYVWKPTQVAKLVESLYRGYPSGSLLFWQTDDAPQTRAVSIGDPVAKPAVVPLYLLDGQQRLTSLHRVLKNHSDAAIVFNVEKETFQNQSAATARDPRWIKVHDVLKPGVDQWELVGALHKVNPDLAPNDISRRLQRLAAIPGHKFHMEVLRDFPYEEVTQIFVRVNSGGRSLKTSDLALATLSARWPGVLAKLEIEAAHWAVRGYGHVDVTFLTRALTGAVLGRGLSAWSHSRLVAASDEELERGWTTVRRGLRHLVPLLQNNLGVSHSKLLPSMVVLLPLIVLLGERADEKLDTMDANGILYWFLVATTRNRYSGSTDTRLGQDIPAARTGDPVRQLLSNLGVIGAGLAVTPQDLVGRSVGSPFFFLSFLTAKEAGARDWWGGIGLSAAAEGSQTLEYHHIHPQATLKNHAARYSKAEINDLANLAFISGKANRKISHRSPSHYFPTLGDDELAAHLIPLGDSLRDADTYRSFLAARRVLLAEAMTKLLHRFKPEWLDLAAAPADPISGSVLEFVRYDNPRGDDVLVATARGEGIDWSGAMSVSELDNVLSAARAGVDGDLIVAAENVPVRIDDELIEIPLGPFLVTGTATEWSDVLDREKDDAQPIADYAAPETTRWDGERLSFPVTSTD